MKMVLAIYQNKNLVGMSFLMDMSPMIMIQMITASLIFTMSAVFVMAMARCAKQIVLNTLHYIEILMVMVSVPRTMMQLHLNSV